MGEGDRHRQTDRQKDGYTDRQRQSETKTEKDNDRKKTDRQTIGGNRFFNQAVYFPFHTSA